MFASCSEHNSLPYLGSRIYPQGILDGGSVGFSPCLLACGMGVLSVLQGKSITGSTFDFDMVDFACTFSYFLDNVNKPTVQY